jgi:hypothetical protein
VVKEIEGSESKPAGNLIHHPGKLDGVFTGDGQFLWPSISFTIQTRMESPPRGSTIKFQIIFRWIKISEALPVPVVIPIFAYHNAIGQCLGGTGPAGRESERCHPCTAPQAFAENVNRRIST